MLSKFYNEMRYVNLRFTYLLSYSQDRTSEPHIVNNFIHLFKIRYKYVHCKMSGTVQLEP